MANEITINTGLSCFKNSILAVSAQRSGQITQSGKQSVAETFTVPTSAATIGFGPITGAPAFVQIKNNDATNYIDVGGDSGLTVFKIRIQPGATALFSPTSATVYWKANSATVDVQMEAVEA